ncbi:MAG TPA: multidrug efflux RND transporter permease subunit [Gemmatimonadales bacterium]|nr:multidrug efflux RND transporter permease subunit [Gemmatimonadales bacterium]
MARFFVDRPIVAIVIAVLTVVLGVVAMTGLPVAQFPSIIPPVIQIQTTFTGADAITIEQSVATPLEQQMNGVEQMLYMQSTNANDGTMTLQVTFDVETEVNIDQVNAQNRAAQAQPNLPADVILYGLTYRSTVGLPLIVFALTSPKGTHDSLFLGNYALINVNDALYRVRGVGQVINFGLAEYAMRIWVKPDTLAKLGVTVPDLVRAVREQSAVNPSGRVGGEPAPAGQQLTYTVRSQGRLVTAEEFGRVVVRLTPDGSVVRLADVARIELGAQTYNQSGRFDGRPSALVAVFQSPGANALSVAEGVKATMDELKTRFPDDLDYEVGLDTTRPVTEGIAEIVKTIGEATLLVIVVVFLFLQNWRATLIPLIAVPVSLVGTFAFFPFLGFSINTLSLFALVLAIGLVVDDAIVVVEAVERHIELGLSPREATLKAMSEVSGPVVGIALVLSAVFVPIGLMGGIQGRLNQQFAVTIALAVVISAFNALSLSPALSALILRPRREARGPLGFFFRAFNRGFARATHGYVDLSHGLARKAVLGLAILAAFAILAADLGRRLPTGFVAEEDQGFLLMNVQLPDAASLGRTLEVTRRIEEMLAETEGVEHVVTINGFSLLTRTSASYTAFFFVTLDPWEERRGESLHAREILSSLNGRLRREVKEAIAFAFGPPAIPGIGTAGGFSFWLQDRSGGTVQFLSENLERFLEAARQRPELANVNSTFRAGVPQVYADVERDKVLKLGVAVADVYQTLQAFLGGLYVNQFNRFGRQWRVFLQAEAEDRVAPEDIGRFYVRNDRREMLPLSTVVQQRRVFGPEDTQRFNLFRAALITGQPATGYSSGDAMAALEDVARQVLPPEMGYDWADLSYQERQAAGRSTTVFALSLGFVFLILAALYESWSLPFSVLLSVPVAVVGAFLGLFGRGLALDVYGQIGLVMLIGLAAKNAILIVEFAKDEFERGATLMEAALEGARLRLRPILMTSLAFILGCVPLWSAQGAGAAGRQILGTTVISGMLAATGLAIFIIPALYVLVERLAGAERRRATRSETDASPTEVGA